MKTEEEGEHKQPPALLQKIGTKSNLNLYTSDLNVPRKYSHPFRDLLQSCPGDVQIMFNCQ